jgi:hypothetical protein
MSSSLWDPEGRGTKCVGKDEDEVLAEGIVEIKAAV